MAKDVVRAGGLLNPPRVKCGQLPHLANGLIHVPNLIGIHHQLAIPADLFPQYGGSTHVIGQVAADLLFEVGPTFGDGFLGQSSYFFLGIAQPTCRGRVTGVAVLQHFLLPARLA